MPTRSLFVLSFIFIDSCIDLVEPRDDLAVVYARCCNNCGHWRWYGNQSARVTITQCFRGQPFIERVHRPLALGANRHHHGFGDYFMFALFGS
jgi:hypothetical protein